MAIIKNAEIWYLKCDEKRPNAKYNKKNPTWEVEIRTNVLEEKKAWEALGLEPKAVTDEETGTRLYWRVKLRRKSIKVDTKTNPPTETPNPAPEVKNGALQPIDPNTVGNGSIANIRIFQYDFVDDDGQKKQVSVLMEVQVIKHKVYKPKKREDEFTPTDTETIQPAKMDDDDDPEGDSAPDHDDEGHIAPPVKAPLADDDIPSFAPPPSPTAPKEGF
jgi:hypothetical protein